MKYALPAEATILAVDPALANTGLVLLSGRNVTEFATVKTPPHTPDCDRMLTAINAYRAWLTKADAVAIEDQHRVLVATAGRGETNATSFRGAQLAAVMWHLAVMNGLPFAWVQVEQWKGALGLRKSAKGAPVRRAVTTLLTWPKGRLNEHVSDAAGIGFCGERLLRRAR